MADERTASDFQPEKTMSLLSRQVEVLAHASSKFRAVARRSLAEVQNEFKQTGRVRGISDKRLEVRKKLAEAAGDSYWQERFIGNVDLLPVNFLERGAIAAKSVCRLELKELGSGQVEYATGFLVGNDLLLTNNHVLPSEDEARRARARFDMADDARNSELISHVFKLDPARFFCTHASLDYTLVAVSPTGEDGSLLATFGNSVLISTPGKTIVSEHLNIIQHPGGQAKQIAIRENHLVGEQEDFLLYETDTMHGSSGSPVFSDNWFVVAVHCSGVPNADQPIRLVDTQTDNEGNGKSSSTPARFSANCGVRISRIFEDLATRPDLTPDKRSLASAVFRTADDIAAGITLSPTP